MKTIKISGMSCEHCVMAVTRALKSIDGIEDVRVNLKKGEATFEEKTPIDMDLIEEKIKDAGYAVEK